MYKRHREMARVNDVITLDINSSFVCKKNGFSLDFGGSVIKIIYTTEVDADTLRLNLVSYPREQLEEAMEFLKEQLGDTFDKDAHIYTTGVGCNQNKDYINNILGVGIDNVLEMECFKVGFQFLNQQFSLNELSHEEDSDVMQWVDSTYKSMFASIDKIKEQMDDVELPDSFAKMSERDETLETVEYPCMIAMCGSGMAVMKLESDGTMMILDGTSMAGRTFMGLGSLLTGAKSYAELQALAENGDSAKVDITARGLNTQEGDVYGSADYDMPMFAFGHTVGKNISDFRREDIAAALVSLFATNTCQIVHMICAAHGAKQLFFCGGLHANSSVIRKEFGRYFGMRSLMYKKDVAIQHRFLKHGAFLGAIGALLKTLGQPAEKAV